MNKYVLSVMGTISLFEVKNYFNGAYDHYSKSTDTYIRALADHQEMNQLWAVWIGKGDLSYMPWDMLFKTHPLYFVCQEEQWSLNIGFFNKF